MRGEIVQSVTTAEKQALMQQVLDQKLSRAELLDLIIDRVDDELKAQIEALTAQIEALPKATAKDFLPLLRAKLADSKVSRSQGWGEKASKLYIEISFSIDAAELPKKIATVDVERNRLIEARNTLYSK